MWSKILRPPLRHLSWRPIPPISSLSSTDHKPTARFSTISFRHFVAGDQLRASQIPPNCVVWIPGIVGNNYCSNATDNVVCWNCNFSVPFLVCKSCGSVQPADRSVDFFQMFGLEKKYEIEDGILEGTYKDWQKKLHPDLVHTKSEKERDYAAEQSARVNDAYCTLLNPLSRAIYILRVEGVEVDEEKTVSEPELLVEIMEIREAVEDASNAQELNQIKSQMQENLRHWSNAFADAFGHKRYDAARTSIQRMTYYQRVIEEIVKKL